MSDQPRSHCAINLALELFGDQWTLLIVRDLMFNGKRHFRELLASEEHIASNVLAERLKRLVDAGILSRSADPRHRQKAIYRLTEAGIELAPVLATIDAWGEKHLPDSDEPGVRRRLLAEGGPPVWNAFMTELREEHLGPITLGPVSAANGSIATRLPKIREIDVPREIPGVHGDAIGAANLAELSMVNPPDSPGSDQSRTIEVGGNGK